MTKFAMVLLAVACGLLASCATEQKRKPVPPPSSEYSNIPWNKPSAGEGAGALGGLLQRQ